MGRQSTIYAIRNKRNGKVYIGRTTNLTARIRRHWQDKRYIIKLSKSGTFRGELTQFEKDFEEFGQSAFEVYQIEDGVSPENCRQREAFWIAEYNSTDPRYGYNRYREVVPPVDDFIHGLPPNLSKPREVQPCSRKLFLFPELQLSFFCFRFWSGFLCLDFLRTLSYRTKANCGQP